VIVPAKDWCVLEVTHVHCSVWHSDCVWGLLVLDELAGVVDVKIGITTSPLLEGVHIVSGEAAVVGSALHIALIGAITEAEVVHQAGWAE